METYKDFNRIREKFYGVDHNTITYIEKPKDGEEPVIHGYIYVSALESNCTNFKVGGEYDETNIHPSTTYQSYVSSGMRMYTIFETIEALIDFNAFDMFPLFKGNNNFQIFEVFGYGPSMWANDYRGRTNKSDVYIIFKATNIHILNAIDKPKEFVINSLDKIKSTSFFDNLFRTDHARDREFVKRYQGKLTKRQKIKLQPYLESSIYRVFVENANTLDWHPDTSIVFKALPLRLETELINLFKEYCILIKQEREENNDKGIKLFNELTKSYNTYHPVVKTTPEPSDNGNIDLTNLYPDKIKAEDCSNNLLPATELYFNICEKMRFCIRNFGVKPDLIKTIIDMLHDIRIIAVPVRGNLNEFYGVRMDEILKSMLAMPMTTEEQEACIDVIYKLFVCKYSDESLVTELDYVKLINSLMFICGSSSCNKKFVNKFLTDHIDLVSKTITFFFEKSRPFLIGSLVSNSDISEEIITKVADMIPPEYLAVYVKLVTRNRPFVSVQFIDKYYKTMPRSIDWCTISTLGPSIEVVEKYGDKLFWSILYTEFNGKQKDAEKNINKDILDKITDSLHVSFVYDNKLPFCITKAAYEKFGASAVSYRRAAMAVPFDTILDDLKANRVASPDYMVECCLGSSPTITAEHLKILKESGYDTRSAINNINLSMTTLDKGGVPFVITPSLITERNFYSKYPITEAFIVLHKSKIKYLYRWNLIDFSEENKKALEKYVVE